MMMMMMMMNGQAVEWGVGGGEWQNRKPVGGKEPHRCKPSEKQSPGPIVPAGDGGQH